MEGVVIKPYGTGHKYARLLGYTSAGKTGTAQIYDFRTAPVHAHLQRILHGLRASDQSQDRDRGHVNGTEGTAGYGGPTSAPVFREVAAAGLRVMDVPKDLPEMLPSEGGDPARRERRGDRRSWFFHPSPAGPSWRCRCCRRPTGSFRKQCFGPAGSFSPEWKLATGFGWAARARFSRQNRCVA